MTFKTRNQGIAALMRYLHGAVVHRRTFLEQKGVTFELDDPEGQAQAAVRTYHRDDGGSGFAIADAKSLLEEFIEIRKTLTAAIADGKEWRNTEA